MAAARRGWAIRRAWRLPEVPTAIRVPVAHDPPLVSIVIPVFNRWRYTNGCLRALVACADPAIPTEIVVVDDASDDRTRELLDHCAGIRVVRLDRNAGFAAACNAGARIARGPYLHFLNNDAFVSPGWLRPLLDAAGADDRVGAVVSQLRYPDDTLAEAGGVIWRDGRGSNYGRGQAARDWRYRSVRDVDYGSAASLLVRAGAFAQAGGFAPEFAPAYYEDADLCFALRARGYRISYQPRSIVYHAEGISYGSNSRDDARAQQARNRAVFAAKWEVELREHYEPVPTNVEAAARRLSGAPSIVVIDQHVPFTDRDAGSRRIAFLIDLLRGRGWHVIFGSIDGNEYAPYAGALREAGTDVICGFNAASVAQLKRLSLKVDAVWLCRPGPAHRLIPAFRRHFAAATIVYDTVDLHFLRLQREQELHGGRTGWQAMQRLEFALAKAADVTITTSGVERDVLAAGGIAPVYAIPVIEPGGAPHAAGWGARRGLIFLGNYAHAPNVDAAKWLCGAIMPLLRQRLPGLRLTLAGADPTRAVRALAESDVEVTGYVADVDALLEKARVFVAPLRFGAGIKGKIVYALAHGIPVVTTPVGAEGIFDACDYRAGASTAEQIAAETARLYEDPAAWEALAVKGRSIAAARFSPAAVAPQLAAALGRVYAG
ncbi:MAG TPA: glycosyltransferase [Candidatus Tumulicola sp.]